MKSHKHGRTPYDALPPSRLHALYPTRLLLLCLLAPPPLLALEPLLQPRHLVASGRRVRYLPVRSASTVWQPVQPVEALPAATAASRPFDAAHEDAVDAASGSPGAAEQSQALQDGCVTHLQHSQVRHAARLQPATGGRQCSRNPGCGWITRYWMEETHRVVRGPQKR